MPVLIGLTLAAGIALAAWRARALSPGGAVAAVVVGTAVFAGGGLSWALPLLAFFVSSSLLTRLCHPRKHALDRRAGRSDRQGRTAVQVLANGAVAGLLAALAPTVPGAPWLFAAFAGALAAAAADTWATEVGTLSKTRPVLITTGRPVEAGRSGAVSLAGTLAGALGGLLVAAVAAVAAVLWSGGGLWGDPASAAGSASRSGLLLLAVSLGGLCGMLVDSLLGATLQAPFYCQACGEEGEHSRHTCGRAARPVGGWTLVTNDTVNLLATVSGALVAAAVWAALA